MSGHVGKPQSSVFPAPLAAAESRRRLDPWPNELLLGRPRRHKAGAVLYHQGDSLSTLHLIVDGAIKLVRNNSAGRTVVVGIRSTGWLLGATSLILGQASSVSAQTLTDATVRPVDAMALSAAKARDPALNEWLTVLLAREAVKHLEAQDATLLGARQRVVRTILNLASACPPTVQPDGSYVIPVSLSHRDLADLLKTSRETATRLVNELARASLATIQRRRIAVPATSWLAEQIRATAAPEDR